MSESGTSRGGFPLQGVYRPGGELPLSPWRRGPLEGLSWEASLLLPPGTAREIRPFLEGPLLGAAGAVTVPVDPASWGEGSERPQGVLVEDLEDWEAILEGAAREKPLYVAAFGGTPLVYPLLKAWGKKQGVDLQGWRGAFLGDPFGQGPLPSSLALELFLEMLEEGREQPSSFSLVSVTPLSLRREGATAAFEGAMALQRMRRWRKALQERGLPFEALLGQAPVLLGLGMDFFEEVARLRALRALWAKETGGTFPLFHGWTLLPEAEPLEPENDAIRAALEIMAGVLGGVKVIHGGPVGGSWGFPPSVARR
ncbi:MAG: methylmalonyl-CoA mutase family protein, partial [Bacillota bacterium]|nr:methylmalonyl-CoA mutase family protein [Bacillota bacterium]